MAGLSSHSWKRPFRCIDRPLAHGLAAGAAVWVIASLGLFYLRHAAREAQLDALRPELSQLATLLSVLAALVVVRSSRAATPLNRGQREFAPIVQPSGDAPLTVTNDVLEPASPASASATPAPPAAAARLLLVEDNFVNQRVALYMLAKLGYHVDLANDGREALDRLGKERYGLVLMDCQMPEMDGFEATKLIRDPSSGVLDHDVPIIAMTANAFPEDSARALECGMSDFLSKPVDRATLSAIIAKWLRPLKEPTAAG